MNCVFNHDRQDLVGVGLYTPAEASRLTGIKSAKIRRWLRGHRTKHRSYDRLWSPQIDIGDEETYLGFRDLTEIRVVDAFIRAGLSAQKIRRAIQIARDQFGLERPLSTRRFCTDGTTIFLILSNEGDGKIIDLFKSQYAFRKVVEPSLRGLEFDETGEPTRWHIVEGVLIDPGRSFGRPVDDETFVPTEILAAAAVAEGSIEAAARVYRVSPRSVRQAVAFETAFKSKRAS